MMNKLCLSCQQPLNDAICQSCGLQDISHMTWIPESVKNEFAVIRKPISSKPSVEKIRTLAEKAMTQCNVHPNSLSIVPMENGLLDNAIDSNNPKDVKIYCNLKNMRCYTDEELLALLREQALFTKTFDKGAPFTSISAIQQQIDFRFKLKLAYDAFIVHKGYSELFPNDQHLLSAKRMTFSSLSVEYFTTKHEIFPDSPFLQPAINAIEMYRDASYFFFVEKQKLERWINENNFNALYIYWKWLHEDFTFIWQNTSGRGETEKLLQITEFLISNIFSSLIFESNKVDFLTTFQQNMQTVDRSTTNPIGRAILRSWKTRFNTSPYEFP